MTESEADSASETENSPKSEADLEYDHVSRSENNTKPTDDAKPQEPSKLNEVEFLFSRYDRVVESSMKINRILHTTFYLSAVVIAGIAGVLPQFDSLLSRVVLYMTGALLFLAILGFTMTYINSRRNLIENANDIAAKASEIDHDMDNLSPEDFASKVEEFDEGKWENYKDMLLPTYYLLVSLFFVIIMITDVWLNT